MSNILISKEDYINFKLTYNKSVNLNLLTRYLNENLNNIIFTISFKSNELEILLTEAVSEVTLTQLIQNYDEEGFKFLYNNEFYVNTKDDFSLWQNFYLKGKAIINAWGDKEKIQWFNSNNELAIEEYPIYTRQKLGQGLLSELLLTRDLTIRYFRKNGSYQEVILPTKTYNEVERKYADTKSRTNIIEDTRQKTGEYIYMKNMQNGTPQNIETELGAALHLLDSLQPQISVYRSDREHTPLVIALQNTLPTQNVPQDVLDFIINKVNIDYYE